MKFTTKFYSSRPLWTFVISMVQTSAFFATKKSQGHKEVTKGSPNKILFSQPLGLRYLVREA